MVQRLNGPEVQAECHHSISIPLSSPTRRRSFCGQSFLKRWHFHAQNRPNYPYPRPAMELLSVAMLSRIKRLEPSVLDLVILATVLGFVVALVAPLSVS